MECARFTTTLTEVSTDLAEVSANRIALSHNINMPVSPPRVSSLRLIQLFISEIRLKATLVKP